MYHVQFDEHIVRVQNNVLTKCKFRIGILDPPKFIIGGNVISIKSNAVPTIALTTSVPVGYLTACVTKDNKKQLHERFDAMQIIATIVFFIFSLPAFGAESNSLIMKKFADTISEGRFIGTTVDGETCTVWSHISISNDVVDWVSIAIQKNDRHAPVSFWIEESSARSMVKNFVVSDSELSVTQQHKLNLFDSNVPNATLTVSLDAKRVTSASIVLDYGTTIYKVDCSNFE